MPSKGLQTLKNLLAAAGLDRLTLAKLFEDLLKKNLEAVLKSILWILFSGLQDMDSLMDCQGAQEEPERRPGGLGRGLGGDPLPAVWRSSGLPGLPSGSSWAPWQPIKISLS